MWGNSRFPLPHPLWRDPKTRTFPHSTRPNLQNLKGIASLEPDTQTALLTAVSAEVGAELYPAPDGRVWGRVLGEDTSLMPPNRQRGPKRERR